MAVDGFDCFTCRCLRSWGATWPGCLQDDGQGACGGGTAFPPSPWDHGNPLGPATPSLVIQKHSPFHLTDPSGRVQISQVHPGHQWAPDLVVSGPSSPPTLKHEEIHICCFRESKWSHRAGSMECWLSALELEDLGSDVARVTLQLDVLGEIT